MESMAYFHRIYGIVPWNPLNFCGINGKNLWHFMNFPNFLLLIYLPSTAMETLKTPSEYSVDFTMSKYYIIHWFSIFMSYNKQDLTGVQSTKTIELALEMMNSALWLGLDQSINIHSISSWALSYQTRALLGQSFIMVVKGPEAAWCQNQQYGLCAKSTNILAWSIKVW